MSQNTMFGHGGWMSMLRADELTIAQSIERRLHGTFGNTGFIGDHSQTHCHRPPALSRRPTKQKKINQKSGGLLDMSNQVPHQNIEDIIVHWNCSPKSRHNQRMPAILILGQYFLLPSPALAS